MTDTPISLSSKPAAIMPYGYSELRTAITAARDDGISTAIIVDGEPAGEICPPGQQRAADVLRDLVIQELSTIMAILDEEGTPAVLRVVSTRTAIGQLQGQLTSAVPGQHLTWHEGEHGWLAHDGYPRHKHALNGRQVTGENGPYLERRNSGRPEPDLAGVLAAMALRLAGELHTLGEICDAAGMTRRSPDEIAGWLLYGNRS
jgi:hypothetical protein